MTEVNDDNYTEFLPKGNKGVDEEYAETLPPHDEDITDEEAAEQPIGVADSSVDNTVDEKKDDNMRTTNTGLSAEPAVALGTAGAVVAAIIGVLVVFGVPLTNMQTQAILALVAIVTPLVTAFVTRHFVTPVSK